MPRLTFNDAGPIADERIVVAPVEGGWSVQSSLAGTPLMFLSGAQAEQKAKSLAASIAASGYDAQVLIHDRGAALVGTIRFFAADASSDQAAR